jgi:hypothetical protein
MYRRVPVTHLATPPSTTAAGPVPLPNVAACPNRLVVLVSVNGHSVIGHGHQLKDALIAMLIPTWSQSGHNTSTPKSGDFLGRQADVPFKDLVRIRS